MMKPSSKKDASAMQHVSDAPVSLGANEPMRWLVKKDFTKLSSAARAEAFPVLDDFSVKLSTYARRIRRAKRNARSELDVANWARANFANLNFHIPDYLDKVPRIDIHRISQQEFIERFERPALPVVLTGVTDNWKARENWTPQKLLERFHNEKFKIGEDDDEKTVHIQFSHFMYYCVTPGEADKDDSPLYIFDPNFGDRSRNNTALEIRKKAKASNSENVEKTKYRTREPSDDTDGAADESRKKTKVLENNEAETKIGQTKVEGDTLPLRDRNVSAFPESRPTREMLNDYEPPIFFRDDLFQYTGSKRPPHRWIVIGPKRSGTGIHVDPLGTSAWNTLLSGHKRWALFPPSSPKHLISFRGLPDHEASTWFALVYPRLHDPTTTNESGQTLASRLGIVDIIQRPGETVFVPGGWHHVVVNLDFAVGVTQNFCSVASWESVWLRTRDSRPRMAKRLLEKFEQFSKLSNGDTLNSRQQMFGALVTKARELTFVPKLPPSSSDSSDSSSSSSSSDSETEGASQDDTASESSDANGRCMCRRCKIRRKRKDGTLGVPSTACQMHNTAMS
ncbi:hypothetical protein HDU82_000503 [Entophlyctis luteolus]|nr:hypothetical protein HDU82_000503 [Entophlyctis luteolus]